MHLARSLGRTLEELGDMPAAEFGLWLALARLEAEERGDIEPELTPDAFVNLIAS